jgi:hypothetical protein
MKNPAPFKRRANGLDAPVVSIHSADIAVLGLRQEDEADDQRD